MASRGVNKVILVGNLGKDPETRYFPSGGAVTNITVATSESWKDKQTGENQERTEWHRVSFFGRLAEIAGEFLRKGSKVFIEGRLQTRKWQDQNGNDRYTTEIIANEMQMLDSRNNQSNGGGYEPPPMTPQDFGSTPSQGSYQDNNPNQNYSNPKADNSGSQSSPQKHPAQQESSFSGMDNLDDDIPF